MSFDVAADAYDRFMGRYSIPLAPVFADFAGIGAGQRVVDVGCGPGALTVELVRRLGAASVAAVDPSASFVGAIRERQPDVDVRRAAAEELPFDDGIFDAALAQLVVHFMPDPVAGLREMARVARPGGTVAACVWDHEGGTGPLDVFWRAAHQLDPNVRDESTLAGAREGHLRELLDEADLTEIEDDVLEVRLEHPSFEAWWEPYTMGVGPAGAYVAGLDEDAREQLKERCRASLPAAPFAQTARAWAARGTAA
jgi:ubiquinone/menaquinone biosynthesis C-methylase UbiE